MADEAVWKRRFMLFTLVRLTGLAIFVAGIAVGFSDFVRPGGWPALGAALIVIGVVDAVLAPKVMRRQWEKEDSEGPR